MARARRPRYLRNWLVSCLQACFGYVGLLGRQISRISAGDQWRKWFKGFLSLTKVHQALLLSAPVIIVVAVLSLTQALAKSEPSERIWHFRLDLAKMQTDANSNDLSSTKPRASTMDLVVASSQDSQRFALDQAVRPAGSRAVATSSSTSIKTEIETRGNIRVNSAADKATPANAAGSAAVKPITSGSGSATGSGGEYYVDLKVQAGESLTSLLGRYDVGPTTILRLSKLPKVGKVLRNIRPGNEISFFFDKNRQLTALKYQINKQRFVSISSQGDGYAGKVEEYATEVRLVYAEGQIDSSLFHSGHRAGLTDKVITKFAEIFSWDLDFARDLRPGDKFEVLYENKYINGQFIGSGRIWRARIQNRSRWLDGIRFEHKDRVEYFNPSGVNLRKAFIRNPLDPALISSRYSKKRFHPVLKVYRPHLGVDYGAPTNTPIRATGYGTVSFRGTKGGYGKTVIISHGDKYQTLYAHMNRFVKSVKKGNKVSQGQIIGYVGSTGLSTGPHLHYEFRINGKHTDPQKVKLPPAQPLRGEAKRLFVRYQSKLQNNFASHRDKYRSQNNAKSDLTRLKASYQP